jgi:vacuolar-type H+-ATPase subunit E/Vma4
MSLEKIRQAVLAEAKTEADHIIEDADKKVSATVHAQKERIERDSERHYNVSIQAIEDEYRHKLLQYKGIVGKQLLEKRNLIIGDIFEKARKTVLNFSNEEYGRFMVGLINKVSGSIGGKLHIHHDEKNIFLKILPEINKGRSPETKIILDESHPLNERGGFVFIGAEYEVDQTLKTMFNDIEKEMLPVIAKELFSASET